jgi:hypothetical protein
MSSIDAIKDNYVRVRAYCSQKNRQSVTMPDEVRDGEIVGLESSTNGRSCGSHECCGKHLCVGDLVVFCLVILEGGGDGQDTEAMKVIKIKDGTEVCHVGFLQRYIVKGARKEKIDKCLCSGDSDVQGQHT